MNEDEILNSLIFCNICYFPEHKSTIKNPPSLLISYCMHIVCSNCLKETDFCVICNSKTSFIPVSESINSKLKKNPSELFSRPVDICMFQINSSINLIEYLRDEINNYKKLLKLARMEIEKLKKRPTGEQMIKKNNLKNEMMKKNNLKNEMMKKNNLKNDNPTKSTIATVKPPANREKIKKVCDIINTTKRKSEKSTSVLDFSRSSCTTGRLTIPKDFNPYKKFYRK